MNDEEMDSVLFHFSLGSKVILNYLQNISLIAAAEYLKDSSSEKNQLAEVIMNNIIEGYMIQEHSIQ